ncbi:hypothetical protein CDL15_Pgr001742 [Punica granatum]|uniref:Remorin C-terminal domain-containing protein n=1 Tax=Punica granatum TaxID=22663 RepID=A0A218XBK7_PUNGR|nr:hypothetical protein CDL15_Pgr001742 [Punica granatum]
MNRNGAPFSPVDDRKQPGGGGGARGRTRNVHHHQQEPQLGWTSERVPSSAVLASRRHNITGLTAAATVPPLSPFNSGRALPSKWEDAERWICSPVSANGTNSSHLLRNRPKSKSGPLGVGHPGNYFGYAGQYGGFYSPAVPSLEGWSGRGFFGAGSPFSAGVFVADESLMMSCVDGNNSAGVHHGWLEERVDASGDAENGVTRAVSRRDMATQMSPKSSICASPKTRASHHHSPPHAKLEEVRDVLMDRRSNVISWSKRHAARFKRKDRAVAKDSHDEFTGEVRASSSWDIRESARNISRAQREEAKIAAWENLQKAKAEAAIHETRKVEVIFDGSDPEQAEKV